MVRSATSKYVPGALTPLVLQSRSGDNAFGISMVCPQSGAAVQNGLTSETTQDLPVLVARVGIPGFQPLREKLQQCHDARCMHD